ncbi:MAG TPA: hypothetical protein VF615_25580 [Longimicrobiaceae bacterium]
MRDGAGVLAAPGDYDQVLEEAVRRYGRARPRRWVADVAGDGGFDYALPAGAAAVAQVEYPAGQREPVLVDSLDWTLYDAPEGTALRFRSSTPAVGETVRLTVTGEHSIAEASTSVPSADHDIVVLIASSLACEQLSSHYTNQGDSTIGADSVDHKSKGAEYAHRAKRFMSLVPEPFRSLEEGEVQAAGGEVSYGEDVFLLTHRQR